MSLTSLSEVVALTAEGSLVDFTVGCAGEWHAIILQFDDSLWCFAGHVMDRILVSKPIGSLHCVVHVPLPVVVLHVAEGGVDATLSGDCVRTGGEEFCDDGGFEAFGDEAECSTKSGATWAKVKIKLRKVDSKGACDGTLPAPTTTASYS